MASLRLEQLCVHWWGRWGNVSAMHGTLSPLWKSAWSCNIWVPWGGVWGSMQPLRAPWVSVRMLAPSGLIAHGSGRDGPALAPLTVCLVSASRCDGITSARAPVWDPCISWSCRSVAASELFHQSPVGKQTTGLGKIRPLKKANIKRTLLQTLAYVFSE